MRPSFVYNQFTLLLALMLSGCAALPGSFSDQPTIASSENPAVEVICLWEPSEGKTPDGKPARGFEGTLLFFDAGRTTPVGVQGEVTVSVFDDYGPRESWSTPISKFTFTPEEWNHFISQGTFGTSYRLFIPYTRKHPYQVKTFLSVKFVPASEGPEFHSRMTHVVLPGPLREGESSVLTTNAELRDRSPENLEKYVRDTFAPAPRKPRVHTVHSWDPTRPGKMGAVASQPQQSQYQLSNHEVTQGNPAGAVLQLSESASGADAESWGSTPPAPFYSTSRNDSFEEPPRKRFRLGPAQ